MCHRQAGFSRLRMRQGDAAHRERTMGAPPAIGLLIWQTRRHGRGLLPTSDAGFSRLRMRAAPDRRQETDAKVRASANSTPTEGPPRVEPYRGATGAHGDHVVKQPNHLEPSVRRGADQGRQDRTLSSAPPNAPRRSQQDTRKQVTAGQLTLPSKHHQVRMTVLPRHAQGHRQ
jgi:hypothetical protein